MSRAPVMFISHGSPMFALEPGPAGRLLQQHSTELDDVKAMLWVSPHWSTPDLRISSGAQPETIHDFGGFPAPLYQLEYPVRGAPELAETVRGLLDKAGFSGQADPRRGLDHGVWVPLLHLRPEADIPVLQLSLSRQHTLPRLLALGAALSALREQGIAIIASGGVTHNLYDIRRDSEQSAAYVQRFQGWLRSRLEGRDSQALLRPDQHNEDFNRAHPTPEHYLPLLIALGASSVEDRFSVLEGGISHYALSMESYLWSGQE
ncbi:DODA-type extradiol aromatic ring-opening family dioxygenase [Neptuniibacter halophilus]|uniref:DODA-type extradiol aromatic ring-opening family dioxygenase n=1 Tax=Neptuniibacter halophilus TaxID=651666 RepID=UPI00257285E0|nr:class III extradiol ring-cleavage dioxygenase [Neptuniibacter halophilus]